MAATLDHILSRFNDMNPEHAQALITCLKSDPKIVDARCIEPLIGVIAHTGRDQKSGDGGKLVQAATELLAERFPQEAVRALARALNEVASVAIMYRERSGVGQITDLVLSAGRGRQQGKEV